jgi:phospholipid transport system substrate-binding protein
MRALAKLLFTLAVGVSLSLAAPLSRALAEADPAVGTIEAFQASLLESMKAGDSLGAKGRARKLAPAVERAFDLPAMTRFSVGPSWSKMSDSERAALTEAFGRLSSASFAHNFASYSGERFDVDPKVETRGPDKLVQGHIIPTHGAPTTLIYRMRQSSAGSWKAIDILYNGAISQLTTRRSDFAATVATGGEPALLAQLNAQTDKLLK